MHYWCEDGRSPVSASCVTIETGVNAGIRNGKGTFLKKFDVTKTGGTYFTKKAELWVYNLL